MNAHNTEDKENVLSPSSANNFIPPPTPLLKKIGFGTGVSVYHLDRSPYNHTARSPWALKTVNKQHVKSQFQDRIETEAKILQGLKHPNIVGFRGFAKTEDGRKVLAMEECTESLGNLIEEFLGNFFEPEKILLVVAKVCKALQYLHEDKGLLHGDLKSYNILIKGDFEEVKLCDFGVALELKTAKVEDYVGTGAWSAPETLVDGPLTDRADIFSLGLIVWEMLALKPPNMDLNESASSAGSYNNSVLEYGECFGQTPKLPEGLPDNYAQVVEIFNWCTLQEWDQRPTARQLLKKLSDMGFPIDSAPTEIVL